MGMSREAWLAGLSQASSLVASPLFGSINTFNCALVKSKKQSNRLVTAQ